jgi:hypothetical protein
METDRELEDKAVIAKKQDRLLEGTEVDRVEVEEGSIKNLPHISLNRK